MLEDELFHILSEEAKAALQVATNALQWTKENEDEAAHFEIVIVGKLNEIIDKSSRKRRRSKQRRLSRQQLWSKYQCFIISTTFRELWADFLSKTIKEGAQSALVTQYVTRKLVDKLLLEQFPLPASSSVEEADELSYIEENALRYIAGYVVRVLEARIKDGHHPLSESLLRGLSELVGDDDYEDHSSDWLRSIDRGGLIHVNQNAYRFFYSVEMEIRRSLAEDEALFKDMKEILCEDIDVTYNWDVCMHDLQEGKDELLKMAVSQYVTVRGFSYAKSVLEQYKQRARKTVEKSKGLRKKICTE